MSASACGRCHACACVSVCICMRMHVCVGIYICAYFCGECCMHFGTGALGTNAWAGAYVTQVCFYTKIKNLRTHSLHVVYICVYLCVYVYMHAYVYGCVCASMILLDTLRRCY